MIKGFFSLAIGLLLSQANFANNVDTLLTIGNQNISSEEFIRVYSKNNQDPAFDKVSLDEYMNLFVNFKLKVMEAEALGYDTIPSFVKELDGYLKQLEKPYFTDESVDSLLMVESYERLKWEIRASHILISCPSNTASVDTVAIYNQAMDLYNRIQKGESFEKLAKKYSADDFSGSRGGDLGFFTSLKMVYPFENAAYNTPVGEMAPLTRSRFGYHIIKVTDKIPSRGRIKCAHIMRSLPAESTVEEEAKQKKTIYEIADSLAAGVSFAYLAKKYSDDRGTSRKGGDLPFFAPGQMVPEFEEVAFAMDSAGDISEPVRTTYGWHIIQLQRKQPLGSFEELEGHIKKKISRDARAKQGKTLVLDKLKKEYSFEENKEKIAPFYTLVDSSIRKAQWDASNLPEMNEVIFTINDTLEYTQKDFADFMVNSKNRWGAKIIFEVIVNSAYALFVEESVFDVERTQLPIKHPEYKHLVQEYHDGILLFNLTDDMVWSKAIEDTMGLEAFYAANKQNYLWDDRVSVAYYSYNDSLYEAKIIKNAAKVGKKGLDVTESCKLFQSKVNSKDSAFVIAGNREVYMRGENDLVDNLTWESGVQTKDKVDGQFKLTYIEKKLEPQVKQLDEARGTITADYQNQLEKEWIKTLKTKYQVSISQEVFEGLIK